MIPSDWNTYRIQEIASHVKYAIVDGPFGSNLKSIHYRETGIPVIQSGFVTSNKFFAKKYVYVDEELFHQQIRSKVVSGDIVMAKIGAKCGTCAVLPSNHPASILAGNSLKVTPDPKLCSPQYLLALFHYLYETTKFLGIKTETAQPAISIKNLKRLKVNLPPLPEQRKIAEILSTWDEAIAKSEQLIAALQVRKKGLMQRLLSGEVRFAGFDGEWEAKSISELGKVVTGSTPPKNNPEYYGGDFPWVSPSDIDNAPTVKSSSTKLSPIGKQVARVVPAGSVLVTCIASIGKNALAGTEMAFNQQINAIVINSKNSGTFLYYFIEQHPQLLQRYVGATSVPIINKSTFEKVKFTIPPTKDEQEKIAEVLQASDAEIELQSKKLAALQSQKKGLMQRLLTGQVRVA